MGDDVQIHFLTKCPTYEAAVMDLEQQSDGPLDAQSAAFKALGTTWISSPGTHIALDTDDMSIIFAVRIQ